jgi:membrane protein DedA with SNARE-associated domain
MAIKKEDLTEEQIKALEKLYKKFEWGVALAFFLYLGFLFLANYLIVIVNGLYVHNEQFQFFMCFGTAIIVMHGLLGTIQENRTIMMEQANKIIEQSDGKE